MPTMLILAVGAMGLVLVVLAVVVVGIRQEPPAQELTRQAPRLMASLTALAGDDWDAAMKAWRDAHPGEDLIGG